MKTLNRICIKDYYAKDPKNGLEMSLVRGHEYLTSEVKENTVTVFTSVWGQVPVDVFAGEIEFTK